jgi:hypothetical protein
MAAGARKTAAMPSVNMEQPPPPPSKYLFGSLWLTAGIPLIVRKVTPSGKGRMLSLFQSKEPPGLIEISPTAFVPTTRPVENLSASA